MLKVIQTIEKYIYDKEGRLKEKHVQTVESNNDDISENVEETLNDDENEKYKLIEQEEPFGFCIPIEVIQRIKPRKE